MKMRKKKNGLLLLASVVLMLIFTMTLSACKSNKQPAEEISDDIEIIRVTETATETEAETEPEKGPETTPGQETEEAPDQETETAPGQETEKNPEPETDPEKSEIRAELAPLYELLAQDGDKAVQVNVKGETLADKDSAKESFDLDVKVNLPKDGEVQFALTLDDGTESKVLAVYQNETISIGGVTVEKAKLEALLSEILGSEYVPGEDETDPIVIAEEETEEFEFDPKPLFVSLSSALDECDKLFESPAVKLLKLDFQAKNGTYSLNLDSKKLVKFIQLLAPDDEDADFDLDRMIDLLDEQLDGALKEGKIKFHISLAIRDDGMTIRVKVQNDKTGGYTDYSVSFLVSDQAFQLPEESDPVEADLSDLTDFDTLWAAVADGFRALTEELVPDAKITLTFSMPQSDVALTAEIVLHLSNLTNKDNANLVTAFVYYNDGEEPIIRLILNETDVYLDMSNWAAMYAGEETEPAPATFYQKFEIGGEPATFWNILMRSFYGSNEEIPPYDDGDDGDPSGDDGDSGAPRFYGYSISFKDEENGIFDIGVTEEDLRARLNVSVYDENDQEIEYNDYTVIGFDGSKSYAGEIIIEYEDGYQYSVDVVIRDPETTKITSVAADDMVLAKGTTFAEAEGWMYSVLWMSDGTAVWTEYTDACTFDAVYTSLFVQVEGDAFDEAGDYIVTVKHAESGKMTTIRVHVYDPENLIPTGIGCTLGYIWLEEKLSGDALRQELVERGLEVWVIYDDESRSENPVDDYEIEEAEGGVFVTWGTFKEWIGIDYGDDSDDEEGSFDLTDYLRFVVRDEEVDSEEAMMQSLENLTAIFKEHEDELDAICTVSDTETGKSLHLVISSASAPDLLTFINYFVGIPGEDGWEDLTAESLEALLVESTENMMDLRSFFAKLTGVELPDVLGDLCFDAEIGAKDGVLTVKVALAGADETQYLTAGVSVEWIDPSADVTVTGAEIEAAKSLDDALFAALGLLGQALTPLMM